jgi:acetoin utilization protein AcuB
MPQPTIRRYMSESPVVIDQERTLADAHDLLRRHAIRHLPVLHRGRLVGVVSQRDLYLLETLRGVDITTEKVAEAMTADPFTTAPDAPLAEVAARMAEHKYGCAVVVEGETVVGVFTTIDACRALAAVLGRARRVPLGAGPRPA